MSDFLNVTAIDLDITPGDKNANLHAVESMFASVTEEADIVALPELFSTGFKPEKEFVDGLAEPVSGDTVKRLCDISRETGKAIAGSFLSRTGSSVSNRAFFIEPGGETTFYDKRHLFSMGAEPTVMNPGGSRIPVVRFRGWNIAVAVCYDLRFPVWCRNFGAAYDLMVFVANWPVSRKYAWEHLLCARAIENQAYILGVNRSGQDRFGDYGGMTACYDFRGRPLASAGASPEETIRNFRLDKNALTRWRDDFAVLRDADAFNLDIR